MALACTALSHCRNIDQKIAVSVIDRAGLVRVLLAVYGAAARAVSSATGKAQTALAFRSATIELSEKINSDTVLTEKISADFSYKARAGGILIVAREEVIAAVGVDTARGSEKDQACALAGLRQVQAQLK